jgi:hypothetical protein
MDHRLGFVISPSFMVQYCDINVHSISLDNPRLTDTYYTFSTWPDTRSHTIQQNRYLRHIHSYRYTWNIIECSTYHNCSRSRQPKLLMSLLYCNIVWAKGVGGCEGRLESKGEGSWFQARDQNGWGFATMSKTSVFEVSGVFLPPLVQGVIPRIIDFVSCKYKDRIFVCRLKINHAWSISLWV